MFSQLLQQCQQVFKSANKTISQNKKILQQTSKVFPQVSQTIPIDPTKTYGNSLSFSKAQRFKPLEKQQLNLSSITQLSYQNQQASNRLGTNTKCFSFTKVDRFGEEKTKEKKKISQSTTVLYPNYDAVKRNNRNGPVIKPSASKDLSKSNVSQSTNASFTQVGPGKYFIQNVGNQPKKTKTFSKQKRFKKQKPSYQDNPLFINENQTKKRPPSAAVLKKNLPKNIKLISKQQQQQMRERLKMVYWQSVPLELDRLKKTNIGPVLRQNYFNISKLTGYAKRCAMIMMLDKLNMLRGGFDNQLRQKIQQKPCGVVYRKSTPKPFKFSQVQPGPDYYYPKDDLIKPTAAGFSFGKQGQSPALIKYDDRDYQINQQLFKKGGNIIINPIHQQHKLTIQQVHALNRGPGYYECLFNQVQKRTDLGVLKYVEVTQQNARQNNCVDIKKDVNDALYFVSYKAIDKNVNVPLYKQDANVKPMHLPDKILFPEHWLFYDGDLNKVRAEIAKNVILAKNMDFKTYKKYTEKFQAFKSYLKSRQPVPQVGEYDVNFKQIDPHVQGFEMAKKPEKTLLQPIVKQQGDVEGDNLLLQPKQPQKYLPNIQFNKMAGRSQFEQQNNIDDQPKQGDRLLLDPKFPQKKLPDIKFDKMVARQHILDKIDPQQPVQGNVLILDPKPIQKHIPQIDFSKYPTKVEPQIIDIYQDKQQIILEPKPVQKKIKGFVDMQRMTTVRMVPYLREKSRKKGQKKEGSLSKKSVSKRERQSQRQEDNQ